jgi:glutathione S-transferase
MDKLFEVLDQLLKENPYLEGDRFGVSDVAVGCVCVCIISISPCLV